MASTQTLSLSNVANSVSVANNTSKVRILWQAKQTGESRNNNTRTAKYWVSINGGAETAYTVSYTLPANTTKTILDITLTVKHKDDGTGTVKVRTWMDTRISAGVVELSDDLDLTKIARASTISSAAATTLGSKCSVKWTPLATAYRYKLKFKIGTWSYTTAAIHPNSTSAYTYSGYTIPLEMAQQILNKQTGTMTVELYTYSDSGATKQVGDASSKTFTVTVPANDSTKPAVTMELAPVSSLPAAFAGLYIQGKSKVKATLTAEGKYGASISSYGMTVDGTTYGSAVGYTSGYLASYGTFTVTGTAKDSRGITGATTEEITVIPYGKPQILPVAGESEVVATRCDADGNITDSGTYLKIKAKRSYSPCKSGDTQMNFCQIRFRYRVEKTASFSGWTTVLAKDSLDSDEIVTGALMGGALAVDTTYIIQVGVIDDVGESSNTTITVHTDRVYDHEDGARRAKAFGKYVEEDNTYDFAEDITVKVRGELVVIGKGWITPTLSDDFVLYDTGPASAVRYRKVGGIVEIRGAVKPVAVIAGSNTASTIFTLPEGYRPDSIIRALCQGSGGYHWMLTVNAAGAVSFSRYSDGNVFVDTPTTAWLPFQLTFIADQ